MGPGWTFIFGLVLLVLFGWYFATDSDRVKRILGSALAVLLVFLCVTAAYPPDKKLRKGLDISGGTSFLLKLVAEPDATGQTKSITPAMVDQAVETIRKRVDSMGNSEPIITPAGEDRI